MTRSVRRSLKLATSSIAATLILAALAQAGPPLICHAIQIGDAQSLPWSNAGWSGAPGFDVRNLVRDTLSILGPDTPVLVRMETLRRATIYARQDPRVAKELLTRLYNRASASESAGRPDALAWFDAGYLVECYGEWLGQSLPHMTDGLPLNANPAAGLDGYAWVTKAISLKGSDPEMEFAAALITLEGAPRDHAQHLQRAIAGSKHDPLLAQNLSSHFVGSNSQTMAELLQGPSKARNWIRGLERKRALDILRTLSADRGEERSRFFFTLAPFGEVGRGNLSRTLVTLQARNPKS